MGLALDTVLGSIANAQATFTPVTFATGDSGGVRSFPPTGAAYLEGITVQGDAGSDVQVKSPMFHDNIRGIQYSPGDFPARFLLPPGIGQPLVSQDVLTVSATSGATNKTTAALFNYYTDLSGASARLNSWGDISGMIKSIKPLAVTIPGAMTPGQWLDLTITSTENLLHANTWYAVLGFITDTALTCVGVRGQDTSNLRVCGPGSTVSLDMSDYFIVQTERHGRPHIPCINSANKDSTYVSLAANTAVATGTVSLVLAELSSEPPK